MAQAQTTQVKRRQVFYLPGYDPFPARRYRELYRKEGQAQAAISGYELSVEGIGGRPGLWTATSTQDGMETRTDFEVLEWSDIVRDSMQTGIVATYGQLVRTGWIYCSSGALSRLFRLRKGPVIAALYPVVMLLGQLALAIGVASMVYAALAPVSAGLGAVIAVLSGLALLEVARRMDHRLYAYYLMHDYAYTARHHGATPPALQERLDTFAERISEALAGDVDEVLVVGHSSGAHLGVEVLARVLRSGTMPEGGPALSFLTLGQVIPMVSFLPDARDLRRDLTLLAEEARLSWVDVTAPGDGCAFALCDPVAVTGLTPDPKRWPLILSASFSTSLSPERWKALRWRFFRLHFQYLCAFDIPGSYDYFQITAGPRTLGDRFAGRSPSPSRIATPLSRHRDCAA